MSTRFNDVLSQLAVGVLLLLALGVGSSAKANSCNPSPIVKGESSAAPVLKVERQQGWLPSRDLRFGEFWTEQYKVGVTQNSTTRSGSNVRAEGRSALRFEQHGPDGLKASVTAASELRYQEKKPTIELGGDLGSVLNWIRTEVIDDVNAFNGQVTIEGGQEPRAWSFSLTQPDQTSRNKPEVGLLNGPAGQAWHVLALHAPLDRPIDPRMPTMAMPRAHLGVEVKDEQGPVAALLKCRLREEVWIHERVDAEQRLVLASLFSAMLGRQPLGMPGNL